MTTLWLEHSFTISDAPPAPPPPADVAVPEIRTEVSWLSCDLATGRILAELPDMGASKLSRVIGAHTSATLQLPIPRVGGRRGLLPVERAELARRLTEPCRRMIVAVVNDVPMWAGIVLNPPGGTDAVLRLSTVTLEAYLDHRFTGDHDWVDQDEAAVIAAGLLGDANAPVAGIGGGIGLTVDAPPTGRARERHYRDADNGTVYEDLRELMGVIDGPEFTIDLDWADSRQQAVAKIARVRSRIGVAAPRPAAVFQTAPSSSFQSLGAAEVSYTLERDHGRGRFANVVQAYSSGQGDDQPRSAPAIDRARIEAGFPIFERRWQPSSSISSIDTLNEHAAAELRRVRNGAVTWKIEARWDAWPRYGVDWRIGDDVAYELTGHLHPSPVAGRPGVVGVGRAIGVELDMAAGRIVPILQDPLGEA